MGQPSGEGRVVVTDRGPGSLAQNVQAGHHELTVDEPAGKGGDDKGPNPYDLLLASLGSCVTMTVRMYADRKDWPLERVSAGVSHERTQPGEGRGTPSGRRSVVDRIDLQLTLDGNLTDDQVDRLVTIAKRCPVHRTLTGDIRIAVELAPGP